MLFDFTVENTAVVLVDHQVGTIEWAGGLTPEQREQVKLWARLTARFAKGAGMPIVLTSSLETEAQGSLLPEFQEILPDDTPRASGAPASSMPGRTRTSPMRCAPPARRTCSCPV